MNKSLFSFFLILFISALSSCQGRQSASTGIENGDTITTNANLLTIIECDSYTITDIYDPWNEGKLMQRYILIEKGQSNDNLPDGTIVNVPLQSSLVYSSVHAGAIKEIGSVNAITAICDARYYKIPEIINRLKAGKIIDAGASMSPSIEKIVDHAPQAILTSPFQNAGHGAIEQLGIPIIECADYMETTPLGRAEWIKLIGRLYGNKDRADSIFKVVSANYLNLTKKIASGHRPTVISEMVTDGVWYLPGGASYMAKMFHDAGAEYPWKEDSSTGSLQLDFATVYDKAHTADFWLIKTFNRDLTLDELKQTYPLHEHMNAFHSGGVYACNTATTTFFEDFPFHPDMLLADFINIFHPGTLPDSTLKYYKQVK